MKCIFCNNEIVDGERVYLLLQGTIDEWCFIRETEPINLLVCAKCIDAKVIECRKD